MNSSMLSRSNPLNQSKLSTLAMPSENTQSSKLLPKICWLETVVSKLQTQLSALIEERESIRKQKEQVSETLMRRNQEAKESLLATVKGMEEQLVSNFQKGMEDTKVVQGKLDRLKNIQLQSQKQLLGIQRRINQLQVQIGL